MKWIATAVLDPLRGKKSIVCYRIANCIMMNSSFIKKRVIELQNLFPKGGFVKLLNSSDYCMYIKTRECKDKVSFFLALLHSSKNQVY